MSRELAATVILEGEDGRPVILPAGSVPSEQQAAQITNPKAWGDEVVRPEVPEPEPEPVVEPEPEPVVEPEPEPEQQPKAAQPEPEAAPTRRRLRKP